MYDFDKIINRKGTASVKWDVRDLFEATPEQKLIRMQSRSDLLFFVYYRMKQWIWKKRGNL